MTTSRDLRSSHVRMASEVRVISNRDKTKNERVREIGSFAHFFRRFRSSLNLDIAKQTLVGLWDFS